MATNFFGAWDVCQEAARRLVAAHAPGSLLNVASVLGMGAAVGHSSYSASKGALIQLTRTLALEFVRHGIRVNALAPGWFVSAMNQECTTARSSDGYVRSARSACAQAAAAIPSTSAAYVWACGLTAVPRATRPRMP